MRRKSERHLSGVRRAKYSAVDVLTCSSHANSDEMARIAYVEPQPYEDFRDPLVDLFLLLHPLD
jgi:hypothetical protein